jgi:hypothetical protein
MAILLKCGLLAVALAGALESGAAAQPTPVRHVEGTEHGFLVLREEDGRTIAAGDLFQVVHGDRVTSRLVFHFKDGSVDDETALFSQRGRFQLITDRHIQSGPSFPHPMDLSIDVRRGQIASRSTGKDGKEEVKTDPIRLPPDLVNGFLLSLAKNILPDTPETTVSMLVATPKPRMVKLAISPRGEEPYSIDGSSHKAMRYEIKFELGGIAGVVAPLIGKQPPNIQLWIAGGIAPAFVREKGPLYEGGPIWDIQLSSPVWPDSPR